MNWVGAALISLASVIFLTVNFVQCDFSSVSSSSISTQNDPLPADAPSAAQLYPASEDARSVELNGYGQPPSGIERVDETVVELPAIEETQEGETHEFNHQLPDTFKNNQFDLNKEIHSYSVQRKIVNINQRNVHRYFKNLNVNTVYNTNIRRIKHNKLQNVLLTTVQDTHQPTLLVKYTRTDQTNDLPDVNTPPEVINEQQNSVLPPIVEQPKVEKVAYDGNPLVLADAGAAPVLSDSGPLVRAVRENAQANKLAAKRGQKVFQLVQLKKKPTKRA